MSLLLLGVNHTTASIAVREKVAFAPESVHDALQEACARCELSELVIVSTCNRTELYGAVPREVRTPEQREALQECLLSWLADYHGVERESLRQSLYMYWDDDMVRHLMRVASGLDSMVLGEPQILGQIKSAKAVSEEALCLGGQLQRLFEDVFSVAKRV